MTTATLEKAKELTAAIVELEQTINQCESAMKQNRDLDFEISNQGQTTLTSRNPYSRAAITGIVISLKTHLDKCKAEFAAL